MTLAEAIKAHTLATLAANENNISKTARDLDIDRRTLHRMLRRWGLREKHGKAVGNV